MADCKIVNESVKTAIENIGGSEQGALTGIAKEYKDAGDAFIDALTNCNICNGRRDKRCSSKILYNRCSKICYRRPSKRNKQYVCTS